MDLADSVRKAVLAALLSAAASGSAWADSVDEAQASADSEAPACSTAMTTPEINQCLRGVYDRAEERRASYLAAAIEHHKERTALVASIEKSSAAFAEYRKAECGAVYDSYGYGTLRSAAYLDCATRLTDERTHTIWQNWLTFGDSTEALLPEPEPTP